MSKGPNLLFVSPDLPRRLFLSPLLTEFPMLRSFFFTAEIAFSYCFIAQYVSVFAGRMEIFSLYRILPLPHSIAYNVELWTFKISRGVFSKS